MRRQECTKYEVKVAVNISCLYSWYLRKVRAFMICDYNHDGVDGGDDEDKNDDDDDDDEVDILY